jgi:hypothetical protein
LAATKRYKSLHAEAFVDDASRANYLRAVQSEQQLYEALVQQFRTGNQVPIFTRRMYPFLMVVVG